MPNFKKSFSSNFQDDDDLKDEIFNKINKDLAYQKALNMQQEEAYNLCKIENNQIGQSRFEYCLHFERNVWFQKYMEAKNKLINIDKKLLGEAVNESLNISLNTSDSGYGISEFDGKESVSAVDIEFNENNKRSLQLETEFSKEIFIGNKLYVCVVIEDEDVVVVAVVVVFVLLYHGQKSKIFFE